MITLIKAHVWKYKSIEDSQAVVVEPGSTVLVGKNESGKSAFLEALHKSNSLDKDDKFNPTLDYPRKDLAAYRPKHAAKQYAKVVELTYRIEEGTAVAINTALFGGATVIKQGQTFTRSTDYGNNNFIGFTIDDKAALAALRKGLGDIEGADEVFDGKVELTEVLDAIDEKKLPAENTLAVFSKTWRGRAPAKESSWDLLDGYIFNTHLAPNIPVFLYFDDYHLLEGKINLDALHARKANPKDPDKTALGLLELAGTTVEEMMAEDGYENIRASLESIGLATTAEVFKYWKQNRDLSVKFDVKSDTKDEPPFNTGKNFYVRIENAKHGVSVPFDLRSKGFIWFFSFMVWFSAIKSRVGTTKSLVLLLDEPGLSLHALAQADFLEYIDTLSEDHQVLFTTHSPFMVVSDQLSKVRVVEDRPKIGTVVSGNLEGASDESVFPLQAALGYTIAQNLFIGKRNLLIEGPADLILLTHMSGLLEQKGKTGFISDGVLVPVGGLDKLVTFVSLLGSNKLKITVVHDRGSNPSQKLDDLVQQKLIERKRVMDYSLFRKPAADIETDLEDLIRPQIYLDAFNAAFKKELSGKVAKLAELPEHPRIIERLNKWLVDKGVVLRKDGGFNHYRVAQALLPILTIDKVDPAELEAFGLLFERVNEQLQ